MLQLHALMQAGDADEAMKLFIEEFPCTGDLLQLVTFHDTNFRPRRTLLSRAKRNPRKRYSQIELQASKPSLDCFCPSRASQGPVISFSHLDPAEILSDEVAGAPAL